MKLINILVPALFLLPAVACKHSNKQPATQVTDPADSVATGSFLPVADFIKNDIGKVDAFSGGILKKATTNGKKDSTYIQLPAFHQLAGQFLFPELDSVSFQQHFEESSLMDASTEMMNFIYTPKQADWPLRKVMVYVKPGATGDKVNRIYMEREFTRNDTAIHQKLTWIADQYFYIISIKQPNKGPAVTSMEKVMWDPTLFSEE